MNEIRVRHGQGFGKEAPSEISDPNLRIFLLTIFGTCGKPQDSLSNLFTVQSEA